MVLNEYEQSMLNGEHGPTIQKAMELLVKVGDVYGAERMIDVTHAHIIVCDAVFDLISELTEDVMVKVPTTSNVLPLDPKRIEEMGLPEAVIREARGTFPRWMGIYQRIGAIPCYTCFPHPFHEGLKKGEHIAITESNVAMFANSWLGARTNLEGTISAIASAITGKTPEYGLHLPENRYGKVLIEVDPHLEPQSFDYADYVALAYWTGKVLGDRKAVYQGLSKNMTPGQAKYMCGSQIYNSPAAMFHIVGVTPEAPILEAAFGGKKPEQKFVFSSKERGQVYEELCSANETKVDLVCIGCPHCTLQEISDIAQLLKGRKVSKDVRLWVGTSEPIRVLAKRMGVVDIIEGAGGLVLSDMCTGTMTVPPLCEPLGIGVVATTSMSVAANTYRRTGGKARAWFGSTKNCIDAATKGRWEG